jgi:hypothetical protein
VSSALHPDDSMFHPAGDDPWAYESWWFSFFVPERRLMVYVYPWFRPNLGIAGGGVLAWDDRASEPWSIVHCDYHWHLPCPDAGQMIDGSTLRLPQGVDITVRETLMKFDVRYRHPRLSLDVHFDAVHPANIATRPIGNTQLLGGRIDQCGRITGELVVAGEKFAIDCLSIRDRSWGARRDDNRDMNIGYFHATASATDAFLAVSNHASALEGASRDTDAPVVMGYLIREGHSEPLTQGTVTYERDSRGWPLTAKIRAIDAAGRELDASGKALSHYASLAFPGLFNLSALASWRFDSIECIGELQNTMYPDRWRSFCRRLVNG